MSRSPGVPGFHPPRSFSQRLLVWVAQGFGAGRLHPAPGTWGTLVGMLWAWLLIASGSAGLFACGTLAGLAASVWICGAAERILGISDPSSVVLDEITALPLCFAGWLFWDLLHTGQWISLSELFAPGHLWILGAVFAAFRLFDILKPWPVFQAQSLPGGWGVTADDALAAVYVNALLLAAVATGVVQ